MLLSASGASAASASVSMASVAAQALAQLDLSLAAANGGAKAGHGRFDPRHQRIVARGEHCFDRLEPVEIGGQGKFVGACAVAGGNRGDAFAQAIADEL